MVLKLTAASLKYMNRVEVEGKRRGRGGTAADKEEEAEEKE